VNIVETARWIRQRLKQIAPTSLLTLYRRTRLLRSLPPAGRRLYMAGSLATYDARLSPPDDAVVESVRSAAIEIYGDNWNYYSDALRPEIASGFVQTIESLLPPERPIDYLEIGSCQGVSMALIGGLLRRRNVLGSLLSIDPYFESGYVEGEAGPYEHADAITVNKQTKTAAQRLYSQLGLTVELLELTSTSGLRQLIRQSRTFDLIYIDGSHEGLLPTTDFGLSNAVIRSGGVLVLDDHMWPDVQPIKQLCDRHATKVQETWKTASYRLNSRP